MVYQHRRAYRAPGWRCWAGAEKGNRRERVPDIGVGKEGPAMAVEAAVEDPEVQEEVAASGGEGPAAPGAEEEGGSGHPGHPVRT